MAAGVEPSKGRVAANIIREALATSEPRVTIVEAAARAGITEDGWLKVIRTGRGYERTFLKMARAIGVETEVRNALADMGDPDPFEKSILGNGRLSDTQKRIIVDIYRSPGGWELLQSLVADRLEEVRQA